MAKKVFVGGLPYATQERELAEFFGAMGEVVSSIIIRDKRTGKSKGFGFVEFSEEAAAQKAITELNGKEFGGRTLVVQEARPLNR